MKKLAFVLVALLTLAFTGCKVETSKVLVSVEDRVGDPIADRYVFYVDWATYILDGLLPADPLSGISDVWEVAQTDKTGTVTLSIPLGVSKLKYEFAVFDNGTGKWVEKTVELHRGVNEVIEFVVNK